jgi:hypothetical protein
MKLEILKKDSELLLKLTKQYQELIRKKGSHSEKKKLQAYIDSLLAGIEKNIKENVKESNQTSPTAS